VVPKTFLERNISSCICEICHIWEQADDEPPGEHSAVLHADLRANMREIELPASQLSFVINALQIQATGSETEYS